MLPLFLFALVPFSGAATVVSIPSCAPSAAVPLSPTLVSFSIEQDLWTDWSGTTSRNDFVFNVFDNLKSITGSPPVIRIGANSEDHTIFDPTVQYSTAKFPPYTTLIPYPEALNVSVSDAYYSTARFLPENTHVVWGVNLGQRNLSAAVSEAQSIAKAFSSPTFKNAGLVLDAIEIGNEPDLYPNNGARGRNYSSSDYVSDWSAFAPGVASAAGVTAGSHVKFWVGSFAGGSHSTTGFSPQAIFNEGILNSNSGRLIATFSQHHYSGVVCQGFSGILQDLMSKSTIRGNLSSYIPDIAATRTQGLDYVFGETNSYACHGASGISNTGGAALWALDYTLYAASIGVSRIFYHEGVGFRYNFVQPVALTRSIIDGSTLSSPLPPHVQSLYYAAIIIAEAIGSSGDVLMIQLDISDTYLAGYAFYEDGQLVRALFIESNAFIKGESNRTTTHLNINIDGAENRGMLVKRLAIQYADDTSGLTWGGQSYETTDGRVSGNEYVEYGNVQAGVDIKATEAVLLHFL
ncbi:glycoside hydrolase family 79 protein [Amanita muscaria Koide BX008]|uniref:Glycoside hydrolase family 79 protein n=1 Tax=Amanita muscaria (strain Koide BX008) TaxID=946122 RepID=A0A0C2XF81_AMAMK|nr:glycoside hydrolase family 79 protein [Amanita muscaria Koide BX008]